MRACCGSRTVSATQIAFVYAGDIWVVPKAGRRRRAAQLAARRGERSRASRPTARLIAFSGELRRQPRRLRDAPRAAASRRALTHHPGADRVVDWYPGRAGDAVRVGPRERTPALQPVLPGVERRAGCPEKLPVPYGEFGAFSAGRHRRSPTCRRRRTSAPGSATAAAGRRDIWLFDLRHAATSKRRRTTAANDAQPMWHGEHALLPVRSRRGRARQHLGATTRKTGDASRVTTFTDFDITSRRSARPTSCSRPAGRLYLLDLATEKAREVPIQVVTDRATLKPQVEKVAELIARRRLSPTGKRARLRGARRRLHACRPSTARCSTSRAASGVAERYPRWSPDGKTLAYWSDRSGEYELTLRPADGSGEERTVTTLGAGLPLHAVLVARQQASWRSSIRRCDPHLRRGDAEQVDRGRQGRSTVCDGSARGDSASSWSADSRWLAYARDLDDPATRDLPLRHEERQRAPGDGGLLQRHAAGVRSGRQVPLLSSDRTFDPVYSDFDNTWTYANSTRIVAVPLREDVPSPLAPRNDAEDEEAERQEGRRRRRRRRGEGRQARRSRRRDEADKDEDAAPPSRSRSTSTGSRRASSCCRRRPATTPTSRRVSGKLSIAGRRAPARPRRRAPLVYYDLEEREEKTVLDDADGFEVTADGKKLLVGKDKDFAIVELKADQKFEKPLRHGRARDDASIRGPSGGRSSPTRGASSATTSTTRTCTAWTGTACARATAGCSTTR